MATTSSYFEGRGPEGLAAYGYSRDKRPDRPQLLIGALMTEEGYPVAHEVFPGNVADGATARYAFETLRRRFHVHWLLYPPLRVSCAPAPPPSLSGAVRLP